MRAANQELLNDTIPNNTQINTIVVILKVIERCNINCSYCYFFNGIDTSFKEHAARISLSTIEKIAAYFKNACQEYDIRLLRFDFHGGEPLLLKTDYLASICDLLIKHLSSVTKLEFSLQTNAMLINDKWIDLFNHYKINIGISIDGPQEYHDKYRVDHHGQGTYVKTKAAIDLLRSYAKQSKINFGIGALCVINPEFSPRKIYRHFVDDLKLNSFDFLLPDNTWDSIKNHSLKAQDYGTFLSEIYDEWVKDNNPRIYIRILSSILSSFLNKKLDFHDFGGWVEKFLLMTINSDGGIGPDDTYRSADPKFMHLGLSVYNSTFNAFLKHPTVSMLIDSAKTTPKQCATCRWLSTCKGGSLLHRYSSINRFNNHSIYCDGLKLIFNHIYKFNEMQQAEV